VLLAMAASEERAARIKELKDARPDLTWDRISDFCDVRERSAIEWSRTGGITHENCVRLAELFDVDDEWLWSGRERPAGSGDLLSALTPSGRPQLDRIEALLADVVNRLARLEAATPTGAEELEAELGGAGRPPGQRDDDTEEAEPEGQAEGL
jgi:hypothetical protein